MRNRSATVISLIIVTVACIVGVIGYGYYRSTQIDSAEPAIEQQPPQTQGSSPSASSNTATTYPVKIYFSKRPESENDPGKVFAVPRNSPTLGLGTFAIAELLKGPTDAEKAQGYFTTVNLRDGESNCGGRDFILTIENDVATLRFCRTFDHLGVVADGQADSEIKATLKQFETVKKVIILNQANNCEFDLSGMDLCKQ